MILGNLYNMIRNRTILGIGNQIFCVFFRDFMVFRSLELQGFRLFKIFRNSWNYGIRK